MLRLVLDYDHVFSGMFRRFLWQHQQFHLSFVVKRISNALQQPALSQLLNVFLYGS